MFLLKIVIVSTAPIDTVAVAHDATATDHILLPLLLILPQQRPAGTRNRENQRERR
jgi:hypothetical protein